MTANNVNLKDTLAPANDGADKVLTAHKVITSVSQEWAEHGKKQVRRLMQAMAVFVLLPTVIASIYYGFIVADQYQTEMHISVRSANQVAAPSLLGSFMLGMSNISQSVQDVKSVTDYIASHDAVKSLQEKVDLASIFRNKQADIFTRLPKNATFEQLIHRYRNAVDIAFDVETGGAVIRVRAYTPQDAEKLALAILSMSEEAVNSFNARAQDDALHLARSELERAESRLQKARQALTDFRIENGDIDPAAQTGAVSSVIAGLEGEYAKESARLKEMSAYMTADNVEVKASRRKLAAIQQQVNQEKSKLTKGDDSYVIKLKEYEPLVLEQEIARQGYTSALASMESARVEAMRQHSYIVPIIKPNAPQTAAYPERIKEIIKVFLASLLIFGIGRLVLAGIRDHVMT